MVTANYYVIAGISIFCLIAGLFYLKENDVFRQSEKKRCSVLAEYIIIGIIIDMVFQFLTGNTRTMQDTLYFLKSLEFALSPIISLLVVWIFANGNYYRNNVRRIKIVLIILVMTNFVVQFVSYFMRFMFYIDENNIYHRTIYMLLYVGCLISCIILMTTAILMFSENTQRINFYTLISFNFILFLGIILRGIFKNEAYDWLCISIAFLIMIIYYSNTVLKVDSLTTLLNRRVFDNVIQKINYTTIVFVIDANSFKLVNDKYGHEAGDKTLRIIAKCIFKAFSENGYCFRIGGDEFCVILKPGVVRRMVNQTQISDLYALAKDLIRELDIILTEEACKSEDNSKCLRYGVSQGYGVYYSPYEYPSIKHNLSFEKVLHIADKRMYKQKSKYKNHESN